MHRCLRCLTVNHDRGFVLGDRRKRDSISIILLNHPNDQHAFMSLTVQCMEMFMFSLKSCTVNRVLFRSENAISQITSLRA